MPPLPAQPARIPVDAELARRLDACAYRTIGERVCEAFALLRHQLNARFSGGDRHVR